MLQIKSPNADSMVIPVIASSTFDAIDLNYAICAICPEFRTARRTSIVNVKTALS